MKLIIHDLNVEEFAMLFPNISDETMIIANNGHIANCTGCFGCWIKTPGQCVIRDIYGDMGELISKSKEVTIISECYYGGFSPFVKSVLDRSISYIHPYFKNRNGQMHHRKRYPHQFILSAWIYGEHLSSMEKETVKHLIKANSINMFCQVKDIQFFNKACELEGESL